MPAEIKYQPLASSDFEGTAIRDEADQKLFSKWRIALSHHVPECRTLCVLIGLVIMAVVPAVTWRSIYRAIHVTQPLPWPDHIRFEENHYFTPGSSAEHNDKTIALLDHCAELGLLQNTSLPSTVLWSSEEPALVAQGCAVSRTTVIVLADNDYRLAFEASSITGEVIYAQSVLSTLNALNYSYIFASGMHQDDGFGLMDLWIKYRWNIRLVIGGAQDCWDNRDGPCLRTRDFPEGIDAWRLLTNWYWDTPDNPLGAQWTLSPSWLNDNFHLGYSIEPSCRQLPYILPSHRASPPQAYLLAKGGEYLKDTPATAWTMPSLSSLQDNLGISILAGLREWNGIQTEFESLGLTSVGLMSKMDFHKMLAMSFVTIGVGRPKISPSPWNSLCVGTPFINPILQWDEDDPWNRARWVTQHWRMVDLEPPYVYHVHARNQTALEEAVTEARDTPIESFIHPKMTFEYVKGRTSAMVERDWRGLAKEVLVDRIQLEQQLFEVF